MARLNASELAQRLGRQAEAVCRHYLSNGRKQGNYWQVGDVRNTSGRSMFVRLHDSVKGIAGKWQDSATGEYGDLLDVIRDSLGLIDFADVAEEARRFLSLPHPEPQPPSRQSRTPAPSGSSEAARRLWRMTQPLISSTAEAYLRGRGITDLRQTANLRFHPNCYWRPEDDGPTQTWPAMIAAVTDLDGRITGAHRTWLAPDGSGKAEVSVAKNLDRICYDVHNIRGIGPITAAHIHEGATGVNGPPVITLTKAPEGGFKGCVDAPEWLQDAMKANFSGYYVNIHTTDYPNGAIRGQLGL